VKILGKAEMGALLIFSPSDKTRLQQNTKES